MKSKKMRSAGHEARMGKKETYTQFWWGNLKERYHLEVVGIEKRIILK
jgi:hypothetical protein